MRLNVLILCGQAKHKQLYVSGSYEFIRFRIIIMIGSGTITLGQAHFSVMVILNIPFAKKENKIKSELVLILLLLME